MSSSTVTSALELTAVAVLLLGAMAGGMFGFWAGWRARGRQPRPGRLDVHVDQALAVADEGVAGQLKRTRQLLLDLGFDPDCGRRLDHDAPSESLTDDEWAASEELLGQLDDGSAAG